MSYPGANNATANNRINSMEPVKSLNPPKPAKPAKASFTVKEFPPETVTYSQAVDVASAFMYSFRNDPGMLWGRTPEYRFNGDFVSGILSTRDPIKRLDLLVRKAQCARNLVTVAAWRLYSGLLIDRTTKTYVAYDDADGAPVALAIWSVPRSLVPRQTWYEWGRSLYYKVRAWLYVTWVHLWEYRSMTPGDGNAHKFITSLRDESVFNILNTKKRTDELKSLPAEKLAEETLPSELTYELVLFGCARPGVGIGKAFFGESLSRIESQMKPVSLKTADSEIQLPLQAQIIATREGQQLYEKFGFKLVDKREKEVGEHVPLYISLMTRNYPNKS